MANNLDNFVPEAWSTRVIRNIDQNNVAMLVAANNEYEGEIRQAGDTVHVRTYGNVTVRSYARGQTTVSDSLSPSKEPMTVDQSEYWQIDLDDLDRAQNDLPALDGYTARAGVAMANYLDSYILSFYSSAHSDNQISNGGSAINITAATASTAVYEQLVEAGLNLDELSVPQDQRWAIVSPYFKSLFLKDTTYTIRATDMGDAVVKTAAGMAASQAIGRGYLGQWAGFDVWVSTNLPVNGSNKYCVYGQGKPISFAAQIQPGSVEALRLESSFTTRVRGLVLHGGKVFTEDAKRLGYIYVDNS